MKKLVFLAFILLLTAISLADGSEQLTIEFKNISGSPIENIHVYADLYNHDSEESIKTIFYVREKLSTGLDPGLWRIKLKLDDLSTGGKDYFFEKEVNLTSDELITAYVNPVGSVRGNVFNRFGRAIPRALIKLECSSEYGELDQTYTDSFGSFSIDCLPVGSCKISALRDSSMGYKEIEIKKGEIQNVDITLEKEIASSFNLNVLAFFTVILVVLAFIFYINWKKEKRIEEKHKKKRPGREVTTKRMQDLMKTLNEKEKKVVDFLLKEKKEIIQTKIQRNTGISKASISRTIFSLENKRIIETRKVGKLKKIKLSKWFLKR